MGGGGLLHFEAVFFIMIEYFLPGLVCFSFVGHSRFKLNIYNSHSIEISIHYLCSLSTLMLRSNEFYSISFYFQILEYVAGISLQCAVVEPHVLQVLHLQLYR